MKAENAVSLADLRRYAIVKSLFPPTTLKRAIDLQQFHVWSDTWTDDERWQRAAPSRLSAEDREAVRTLAGDLPAVWHAASLSTSDMAHAACWRRWWCPRARYWAT